MCKALEGDEDEQQPARALREAEMVLSDGGKTATIVQAGELIGERELAERGVAHGLALAKSLGAKVSVIFVVEPFSELTGRFQEAVTRYAELRREQATSTLDDAAKGAKEAGVSCETIQVEDGQPHQAIIAAAKDKGCDLIVMSSHGRSGLSMVLIGSVTNKVLAQAKIPVLVCQ